MIPAPIKKEDEAKSEIKLAFLSGAEILEIAMYTMVVKAIAQGPCKQNIKRAPFESNTPKKRVQLPVRSSPVIKEKRIPKKSIKKPQRIEAKIPKILDKLMREKK